MSRAAGTASVFRSGVAEFLPPTPSFRHALARETEICGYFKNRAILATELSGALRKECPHKIITFQPFRRKARRTFLSLARFFFSFTFQNSLGKICSQLGRRHPCQKSLWRKTALCDLGCTMSGFPIIPS